MSGELWLTGKDNAPGPVRSAGPHAGLFQNAADRETVPDHLVVVGRGLAGDDGGAEGGKSASDMVR